MTEAPTTTPAKRTRKPAAPAPAFDFAAVTPKVAAAPQRAGGRERVANPTIPWVKESWDKRKQVGSTSGRVTELGEGRTVTIPTANAQQLKNLLNYAARDLEVGVSIDMKNLPGGKTQVTFAAKSRKQKKAKSEA
jgi:hypothetical protein